MTQENNVKTAIIQYLTYLGALVIRVNSGAMVASAAHEKSRLFWFVKWFVLGKDPQTGGISDVLALLNGRLIAVECKAPGKRANVTDQQRRFLDEVERRGGLAVVAESVDDLIKGLEPTGATQ